MPEALLHRSAVPRAKLEEAVAEGLKRAGQAGLEAPALRNAVWELLQEAGDTLKRLPDRERGWLTAATRAHWPDYLREAAGAAPDSQGTRPRPAPASAAAIDRLDTVLDWLSLAGGGKPRRDIAVLLGLACGLKVAVLRRQFGCGRRTIYDIRDRGLARICGELRARSAFCRGLP